MTLSLALDAAPLVAPAGTFGATAAAFSLAAAFLFLATLAWASSVFALPGNWIVLLLALLYGWAEGFHAMRPWVLAAGLGAALAGEGAELFSGYLGVKRFGGSRMSGLFALIGAIVGAIVGAGFGWGLGAIPGTLLGTFLFAMAAELFKQKPGAALRAGLGAAIGRALGLTAKLGAGGLFLALLFFRVAASLFQAF